MKNFRGMGEFDYSTEPMLDQCVAWAFFIIQNTQNAPVSNVDVSTEYDQYKALVKAKYATEVHLADGSLGEPLLDWIVKSSLPHRRPQQPGTKVCCRRNQRHSANISRTHPLSLCINYNPASFFQQRLLQEASKFRIPQEHNFRRWFCRFRFGCKCCWRRDSESVVDRHDEKYSSSHLVLVFIASFLLLPIVAMCWWAAFVSVLEAAAIIVFPIRKENKVLF